MALSKMTIHWMLQNYLEFLVYGLHTSNLLYLETLLISQHISEKLKWSTKFARQTHFIVGISNNAIERIVR